MTSELHHLAAAYALNALDLDEHEAFEAHYPSCDVCSAEVADFRAAAAALAESAVVQPPAGLRDKVMAEVAITRQISPIVPDRVVDLAERRRRRAPRSIILAAVAAALVAIVGTVGALRAARPSDFDELIAAPDATALELAGEAGAIEIVWSPGLDRVAVIGSGLADPGPGKIYELWFVLPDDAGVAAAGLFRPSDGDVRTVLEVDDLEGIGWAVTIEPEGGTLQPTSDAIFVATA